MVLAIALIGAILIEVSIAGYFVYTIVPYNKADAEWDAKQTKVNPKEETE